MSENPASQGKNPLREIVQPFIDLVHAPRALWGVNIGYFLEGFVYFGMLGYLAMYFSDFVFRGVPDADVVSHHMVAVLTAGITISMFFLGFVADSYGVRRALIWAFLLLLAGRLLIAGAPTFGLEPAGEWSALHLVTMAGILLVVLGYGMYQPGAYAAIRQFTTPKTAGMAYAMLYALMNLGGWLPSWMFLVRDEHYLGLGIIGTYWVYTALTAVALLVTVFVLSRRVVEMATAKARRETEELEAAAREEDGRPAAPKEPTEEPAAEVGWFAKLQQWFATHPFTDPKFTFFIFALIPVQTLFTYNWLVLPQYIHRAYDGWIGEYFEIAANFNPLLIFIFVPIVTALTERAKVYNMMIIGTFVMAAPAFLLALGSTPLTLFAYLLIMTIGEAMWQPRFLQYAAEIAPEGKTGVYMGVAQFPWFMTKMIVPLYSGYMMQRYCPAEGIKNPEMMWLLFGLIAVTSSILLVLARGWLGKDFRTKAA